jgi:predicted  nucleic acid-binding Zn-ribbon protein
MERLERQVAKMAEKIAATEDYVEAGRMNKELQKLRADLHAAEERWLELGDN